MKNTSGSRYALITGLYVSQAVPLGFFMVALPAILRARGASLENVGLLSALATPWLLKFLWAPFVDRYGSERLGHYRSWILPLQTLSVLTVLAIAGFNPLSSMLPLIVAGAVFMLLAATQDVATDGLTVRILSRDERGTGNGIQVGGYYLGQILGGGVILVVFERFGWTVAVLAMASFLALPLIPAIRYREPQHDREPRERVDFQALGRFFARHGNGSWIGILVVFRAGEAAAITMINPMLVDRGHSLEQIALVLGVAGSLASFGGAILGGLLIRSVGRKPSLVLFGLLQSVAIAAFLVPASGWGGQRALYTLAVMLLFTGGMATTALYTNMMDRCSPRTAATDFSLQQSLAAIGPVVAASASGFSAARMGYSLHFMACLGLQLAVIAAIVRWLAEPVEDALPAGQAG